MNWNQALFPSLHHRKEGWLRHQENFAQPPKLTQTGWFSDRRCGFVLNRKTTPAVRSMDASRNLLYRSATPPCGDARRGMTLDSNSFTPAMTRPVQDKVLVRTAATVRKV